jgi:predicted thioredoxin/glutaredoxin
MTLRLIVTKNCNTCKRAEILLKQFTSRDENLNLIITDINDFKKAGIVIVPALFVEDELYCYGDIDDKKLVSKIAETRELNRIRN